MPMDTILSKLWTWILGQIMWLIEKFYKARKAKTDSEISEIELRRHKFEEAVDQILREMDAEEERIRADFIGKNVPIGTLGTSISKTDLQRDESAKPLPVGQQSGMQVRAGGRRAGKFTRPFSW